MMIAETFTKPGVRGGEERAGIMRLPLVEDEATISAPASRAP
jgi:hypothetical protein